LLRLHLDLIIVTIHEEMWIMDCSIDESEFVGDGPLLVCVIAVTITIAYLGFVAVTAFPLTVGHPDCVLEREEAKEISFGWMGKDGVLYSFTSGVGR
jgi:hypothetical protein